MLGAVCVCGWCGAGPRVADLCCPVWACVAAVLGCGLRFHVGRRRATMKDTVFQSAAYGKRENIETQIDGRMQFDMLDVRCASAPTPTHTPAL